MGLTFANPLPWWAACLVIAGAAFVAWFTYRHLSAQPGRWLALSGLRLATILLLVLFLLRPVARARPDGPTGVVPILVDVSRSMAIADEGGTARIERARSLVRQLAPRLAGELRSEVFTFGEALAQSSADALTSVAPRTDIAGAIEALRERFRGQVVPGVILISDGGETTPGGERAAADAGWPVFPIGVGSAALDGDRELTGLEADESVLDHSIVDLAVTAVDRGRAASPIELRLQENGRTLEVARVTPGAAGTAVRHVFHVSPPPGQATVYTVETPAEAADPVPENNRRSVLVRGALRPRRVLLVEGAPGFEQSFLKRSFGGDAGLDVDAVTRKGVDDQGRDTFYVQAAKGRADRLTSGYPRAMADLFAYDAVVFANVDAVRLTTEQLQWTRTFVSTRGGGLLVLGSRSFGRPGFAGTPLEDVLPLGLDASQAVQPTAGRVLAAGKPVVTDAGASHAITTLDGDPSANRARWTAVPPLAAITPLGGPRPGASVLLTASAAGAVVRPLAAVQRFGEGRTMVFTGEGAWRWRMQLPASDPTYDRFWRQAVRWLALPAEDPVTLRAPSDAVPGGTSTIAVVVRTREFEPAAGAAVHVTVTRPDGGSERSTAVEDPDRPGLWRVMFRPPQAGVYAIAADVSVGDRTERAAGALLAGGTDVEMADPRRNIDVLGRVAAASGGRVLAAGDVASLDAILTARLPEATRTVTRDLWHTGWAFAAVSALLLAEWILRRRWGLR